MRDTKDVANKTKFNRAPITNRRPGAKSPIALKIGGDGFERLCACFDCDNIQTTGKPNVCCAYCVENLCDPKVRSSHR